MVLELCSSGSLAELRRSRTNRTLFEGELRGIIKSVISAIQYLKKELVIHRDIQPSSVLLISDYNIVCLYLEMSRQRLAIYLRNYPDSDMPSVFSLKAQCMPNHPHIT